MRHLYYILSTAFIIGIALLCFVSIDFAWGYVVVLPLFLLGLFDIFQKKHTILRNFPVIGHFRYMFETIRPEISQYFVESDWGGRPLNRMQRSVVYERAKGVVDTNPYGTQLDVGEIGYEWMNHSMTAHTLKEKDPRVLVGAHNCKQPYLASIVNISAMSFGALSQQAILALNRGARLGGFSHNTGEGGLSPFHLQYGGDLTFQIGTGYFGCRTLDGKFDPALFAEVAAHESVKMIELKISQGAKPGHGGILPKEKLTPLIAAIRHVPMDKDVLSPPAHSAFSTPIELLEFIAALRELSGGKPIGFKLCLGTPHEFVAICKAMLKTNLTPDFITVDGGEGGTGAAPLEFSNAVGAPLRDSLPLVHSLLMGVGLRDKIRVIASGKVTTAFEVVSNLAMGADMVNSARAMMLALGCIQSLKCNTNRCPTGVTTQDPALTYGLHVDDKSVRVARYHKELVKTVMELIGAAGLHHPEEITPHHVVRRISQTKILSYYHLFAYLKPHQLLSDDIPEFYRGMWQHASAEHF